MNKYSVLIEAKLDPDASKDEINRNIATLQTKINTISLNITIDETKLDTLKKQIQDKLGNIGIGTNSGGTGSSGGGGRSSSGGGINPYGGASNSGLFPANNFETAYGPTQNPLERTTTPIGTPAGNLADIKKVYDATGQLVTQIDTYKSSVSEATQEVSKWNKTLEAMEVTQTKTDNNIERNINFNNKLTSTLNELNVAQEKIKLSSAYSTGGLPQPKAIQDVNTALDNYANKIIKIQATGGPAKTDDVNELKQLEIIYRDSTNNLRLYEQEQANAVKSVNQQTSAIRTLAAEYKRLDEIQANIANSRLKQAAGSTDPESKQIRDLQVEAEKYKVLIDQISAKGNLIGEDDKLRIAQARIELEKVNSALEKEEKILKDITEAELKNNQLIKEYNKEIDDQLASANKLIEKNQALMVNKSGDNKYVKEVKLANEDLKKSIEGVTNARGKGITQETAAREALEKSAQAAQKAGDSLRTAGKNANSWVTEIGVAIKRTIEWAGAMTLLYGSLRQVEKGIQFIRDLNKELVNIQVVTGNTDQQMGEMAVTFSDLAKVMGATTLEVSKGSLEYFRQGKTIQETSELIKSTMILSKLGNIESAQATEYLTSSLNGFKLEAKDAIGVVDRLIQLDNNFATSSAEVALGLQRSANSAQQVGVTFDELASYIAVVSSVSRRSADSIGESFKTMFARLTNIKLGKMFEDDATNINDVEKALSLVNIQIRDSQESFRPMGDVLDEIAVKWNTMNELEQSAVANAIAGVRQRESFITLITNYNQVLKAQGLETEATGLATKRYDTYLQGLEATTNRFTVAFEKLYISTIDSDFVKGWIDLGTTTLTLVDNIGLLNIALVALANVIAVNFASGKGVSGLSQTLKELGVAITTIQAATVKGGAGAGIASALGLAGVLPLIAATTLFVYNLTKQFEGFQKLMRLLRIDMSGVRDEFKESKSSMEGNVSEIEGLIAEYEALSTKQDKTREDINRLIEIQGILNTKYDGAKTGLDFYTDALDNNSKGIETNIEWMKAQAEQEQKNFLEKNKNVYKEAKDFLQADVFGTTRNPEEQIKFLDEQIARGNALSGIQEQQRDRLVEQVQTYKEIISLYDYYSSQVEKNATSKTENTSDVGVKNLKVEVDKLSQGSDVGQGVTRVMNEAKEAIKEVNEEIAKTEEELQKLFSDQMDGISSANSLIEGLISSFEEQGQLTLDQMTSLMKMFPEEYTKAIYIENGAIKLNTEELKKLLLARAELAFKTATDLVVKDMDLNATREQTDATRAHTKALQDQLFIAQSQVDAIRSGSLFNSKAAEEAKKSAEEQKKAYEDLLKTTIDMIKDRKNAEKDALQDELSDFKDVIDEKKQALEDYADQQQENLQRELDNYEKIINEEKRLIDQRQKAAEYEDEVANKNKELSDIDAELLAMQFDTSEEARARRLELEAERVDKAKELSDIQNDYSVDNQKDALDQELSDFEEKIKDEQDAIDKNLKYQTDALDAQYKAYEKNIKDQIKLIDEYLRSTGQITADAIALMRGQSQAFYMDLIAWNKQYGSSIQNDITNMWNKAFGAVLKYNMEANRVKQRVGGAIDFGSGDDTPQRGLKYHSGGVVGAAGGSAEVFATLLRGETISTPDQVANFFKKTVPNIMAAGGDTINISMPLSVTGNLDKSVLPNLKEIVLSTVNEAMKDRGIRRNSFAYSV